MAKILIAEDERDIRDLIEFTLTYAGHTVHKAANGAEAVDMAPKVMPDLIMMDVRMPRMTGYEACRQIKTMDSVKDIPVVFLSAKGQEAEIDTGLEAGAYDYILKPFAPDYLTQRVAEILVKFAQESAARKAAASTSVDGASAAPASTVSANTVPVNGVSSQPVTGSSSIAGNDVQKQIE